MRNTRFNLIIGSPGTGKSTYVANAVRKYPRNAIVLKFSINIDDEAFAFLPEKTAETWRKGKKQGEFVKCKFSITKRNYKDILAWIVAENFKDGVLVVDDASMFERHQISPLLNDLIGMRRHLGLDIWLVYHGFTISPIDQYAYVNHLVVFNTNDNPEYKKNKIPRYDQVQGAITVAKQRFEVLKKNDPKRYKPCVVTLSE